MQNVKKESTHAWFRLSTNAACCYGLAATYRDPHSVVYAVKGCCFCFDVDTRICNIAYIDAQIVSMRLIDYSSFYGFLLMYLR